MNPHVLLRDEEQIRTVESIERVDEQGYLYHMTSTWNYYDMPKEMAVMLDAGCSCFFTRNMKGEYLLCRNYDYGHHLHHDKNLPHTGLNIVVHGKNPKAKYRSLGVADGYWLDWKEGSLGQGCADDGVTDLSAFAITPYLLMGGINDAGLAVSILALPTPIDWEEIPFETWQEREMNAGHRIILKAGEVPDPSDLNARSDSLALNEADQRAWLAHYTTCGTNIEGLPKVLHPVLMRMMLDYCANVDEAVGLAKKHNVQSVIAGSDYHILLADTSGKSVLLEWHGNEMVVLEINHATNFYASREDKHGYGQDRDNVLVTGMERFPKGMREDYAEKILYLAAQDPTNGNDIGKTQYSCIYNLNTKEVTVYSFGDFSRNWHFEL